MNTQSSTEIAPSAPSTGEMSVRDAANSIEGLLDLGPMAAPDEDDDYEESADADEAEADDAADEGPPSGDEDEEIQEPSDDDSAIPPPASWKADDQEAFKQLPKELQQVVAQREAERDRAINRKLEEIATERKTAEAERTAAAQAQHQYLQSLNQLLTLTVPELRQFDNVDWVRLSQEEPSEYVRLKGMQEAVLNRFQAIQGETQRIEQQRVQQSNHQRAAFLQQQHSELVQKVPEFSDPGKAKQLVTDIVQTMGNYGFNEQELGSVMDHRVVRVMTRLAQLEKAENTRRAAQAKKSATPAPKFQRPNAAQSGDRSETRKMREQYERLEKTGDLRDAARFFENFL